MSMNLGTTKAIPNEFLESAIAELGHFGVSPLVIWALERRYGLFIGNLAGVDITELRRIPNITYETANKIKRAINDLYRLKTAPKLPRFSGP